MRYSDEERKELLKQFELYRLDKGLSIKEAAKLVGVTSGTIARWEDGLQLPHKVQCYQIAKAIKDFIAPIQK
jgi:transcriptional regulator with XRE-family HTH domain